MPQRLQHACFGMVAVVWAATAIKYPSIPNPVPIHWNAHAANGYLAKPWGALLTCFHATFLNAVFWALPRYQSGRRNVSAHTAARLQLGLTSFVLMVNALVLPVQAGETRGGAPLSHTFVGLVIMLVSFSITNHATTAHVTGAWRLTMAFTGRLWLWLSFIAMLSGFVRRGDDVLIVLAIVGSLLPVVYWAGLRRDQTP